MTYTFGTFSWHDGLGAAGFYSRDIFTRIYHMDQRRVVSSVIPHQSGERRLASSDPVKIIEFKGHVFGNPNKTELNLQQNIDDLLAAFLNGVQPLALHADGRYWNAELYQFEPDIIEDDPWHVVYTARFLAADPWAYATTVVNTSVTASTAMTNVSGTLYKLDFSVAGVLGNAPSAVKISGNIITSNGCFELGIKNNSWPVANEQWFLSTGSAVANSTAYILDSGANGSAFIVGTLGGVASMFPQNSMILDANIANPTSMTLFARASSGAPVVSLSYTYTPRYR